MDKLELLYDHYKETIDKQEYNLQIRNKLFVALVIIMGFLFLLANSANTFFSIIVSIVKEKYATDVSGQFNVIQTIVWGLLLYITIRYYQVCISIERLYRYIHSMESRISFEIKDTFDRESINYLVKYPKCTSMINIIYRWIFPLLYILVIIYKTIQEITGQLGWFVVLDVIICLVCLILTILYCGFIHSKNNIASSDKVEIQ